MLADLEALSEVGLRGVLTRTCQLLEEAQVENARFPELIADVGSEGFCRGQRIGHLEGKLAQLNEDLILGKRKVFTVYRKLCCLECKLGGEYDQGHGELSPENSTYSDDD
jgi:hypothetical protein